MLEPGDLIQYIPWDKQKNMPLIDQKCFAVVTKVADDFIIVDSARYACPEVMFKGGAKRLKSLGFFMPKVYL
jgi:hypothetical protein